MENSNKKLPDTHLTGLKPAKKGLSPGQYSDEVVVPLYSFYDPESLKEKGEIPPKQQPLVPVYLPLNFLNRPKDFTKKAIFADFKVESDGDLKLTNKELLNRQSGILTWVIKKAATKIFEGKSVVGLSLPVRIFEARSSIDRINDFWFFGPHYLNQAAAEEPGIDRIKIVTSFIVSALPYSLNCWKPFNPLLGETYQGTLLDGTEVFCEHTSHHPPISNFLVLSKHWKAYGAITYNGVLKGNNFNLFSEGWLTIEFKDGNKLKFFLPSLSLKNMVVGSRKVQYVGSICIKDESLLLKSVIKMNAEASGYLMSYFTSSRQDTMKGKIYRYNPMKDAEIRGVGGGWYEMMMKQGQMEDVTEVFHEIEGSWQSELKIDGETVWNLEDDHMFAMPVNYTENPLPSDCRFREDMIWLAMNNQDQSQIWKTLLEEQQRKDRKLRKIEAEKRGDHQDH